MASSAPPTSPIIPSTVQELAVKNALSHPRISTYEAATTALPPVRGALELYDWNAQVSAAFLAPLHLCEVVIRNAVADAIAAVYGPLWPWHAGFTAWLPDSGKWKMKSHLQNLASSMPAATTTTGKLIPEVNFIFWEKMFTARFDGHLWMNHLRTVMPNLHPAWTVQQARAKINQDLFKIRSLRNRIAHHEPIFSRNLADELTTIKELIRFRCAHTAVWMDARQQVSAVLKNRPV